MGFLPVRCSVFMKMNDFLGKNEGYRPQQAPIFNLNNEQKEAQLMAKIGDLEAKIKVLEVAEQEKVDMSARSALLETENAKLVQLSGVDEAKISDLEAQQQEHHRTVMELDAVKREHDRMASTYGELMDGLTKSRGEYEKVAEELTHMRVNNADLEIAKRSLMYEATNRDGMMRELTLALEELKIQHEGLTSSSDALARQYYEVSEKHDEVDKTNLNLITQVMVLQQQQQDADKHQKQAVVDREKAVEGRVKESFKAQIGELNQDIKELTTLNARYRTELSKPQQMSVGAIARQEGFKLPLASSAVNYRTNNLGTGQPTLLRFSLKEKSA